MNNKLRRAGVFSEILINLTTLKLTIVKLNNLNNNLELDKLGPIFPERMFLVQKRRKEHYHPIPNIRIGLGTKFQLKQTILNFRVKFVQKGYFWSNPEKVNITIELNIFELV